jgi:chromosomal replication initiation ATPase DnaA
MSEVLTAQDVRQKATQVLAWRRNLNGPPPELIRLRRELEAKDTIITELQRNTAEAAVTIEGLRSELLAANGKLAKALEIIRQIGGNDADINAAAPRVVTMKNIKAAVCRQYNLDMSELLSARRTQPLCTYRQIAMYLCKQLTRFSLPEIGRAFGGRDHSTVISAIRRIEGLEREGIVGLLTTNPKIKEQIETIKKRLGAPVDA